MTDEELAERVALLRRRGTDLEDIEAKRAARALPKRLWETLSAFANQRGGGVIILGLEELDDFRAVGVQDVKKVMSDLASQCSEMEPPLRPLVRVHDFEGVQIVVAEIPEIASIQKPCCYAGSGLFTGSFIRVANGDRQMTQYEVHSYLEGRGQPSHDLEAVPDSSLNSLDSTLISKFLERVRSRRPRLAGMSDSELLLNLRVLAADGRATLAGWL